MITIGVRELRQRASEYLRQVRAGESIRVTDRGKPVALLTPIVEQGPVERLEAEGRLTLAIGDVLELGEPLTPLDGEQLPSEVLTAIRDHEA